MLKKSDSTNQKMVLTLIIGLALGVVLAATAYFLINPFKQINTPQSKNTSAQNIELYQKASYDKDVTICDQILGGIEATDHDTTREDLPFEQGKSIGYPQMNQEQARASCRKNVQKAIENSKNRDGIDVAIPELKTEASERAKANREDR